MVRTISFDLWKTLIKSNPDLKRKKAELFAGYVRHPDIGYVQNVIRELDIFCNKSNELTGIQIHSEQMILLLLTKLGVNIDIISNTLIKDFFSKITNLYSEHNPVLYDENTKNVLETLHKDYKLVISSNTGFAKGEQMRNVLKKLDIFKYFSDFYFSDEMDLCKPNPLFFEAVTRFESDEIIHVGDSVSADFKGANDFNEMLIKNKIPKSIKPFIINTNGKSIGNLPEFIKSLPSPDKG